MATCRCSQLHQVLRPSSAACLVHWGTNVVSYDLPQCAHAASPLPLRHKEARAPTIELLIDMEHFLSSTHDNSGGVLMVPVISLINEIALLVTCFASRSLSPCASHVSRPFPISGHMLLVDAL